ncbi:MAG: hypothetical protein RR235_09825 [Oscillospiraceae bacterium]
MNPQKQAKKQTPKATVLYTATQGDYSLSATIGAFSIGRAALNFSRDYKGKAQNMQIFPRVSCFLWLDKKLLQCEPVGTVLLNEENFVSPERCKQRKLRTDGKGICKRLMVTVEDTGIAWQATFQPVNYGSSGEKMLDSKSKPIWSKILLTNEESKQLVQSIQTAFQAYLIAGFVVEYCGKNSRLDINYES